MRDKLEITIYDVRFTTSMVVQCFLEVFEILG